MEGNKNGFPLDLLSDGSQVTPSDKRSLDSIIKEIKKKITSTINKRKSCGGVEKIITTVYQFHIYIEIIIKNDSRVTMHQMVRVFLPDALSSYGKIRAMIIKPYEKRTIAVSIRRPDTQAITLRKVLESKEFQKSNFKLPVALGVSSENKPIVNDLFWMQDIFIGGVTGTGKSMLMHNIIASLIYAKRPEQLKFVLIDTKNVEFNAYSKLQFSYLATFNNKPAVITDPQDVLKVLDSLIYEHEKRHHIQHQAGVAFRYNDLQQPSIVVIIDEISDLIKLYGEEVLRRLYQLVGYGKSSGIHVVCASQNYSCEIVNNRFIDSFQARISFKLHREEDSIRIIGKPDATQLFDKGDMLFHWEQSDRFVEGTLEHFERIQSCLHDTDEIIEMCKYLESPQTVPYVLPTQPDSSNNCVLQEITENDGRDPLFEEAARIIVESQNASTSMLQRRYSIGYARACKIMDQLEAEGIVGPQNGGKPRKVLKRDNEKKKSPFSFKHLFELLNSDDENEDDDDSKDTVSIDAVMKEDDHKGEVSFAELLNLIDEEYSPCEYKLPYEDYIIIGDTAEIDKMYRSNGHINLDIPDFLSTLSKDTVNYVSTGRAEGSDCVVNALADALHKLPIEIEAISKLLFNVWTPKVMQFPMNEMKSMADFIDVLSKDIDIVWGFACDESMEERQARVSLIAASK